MNLNKLSKDRKNKLVEFILDRKRAAEEERDKNNERWDLNERIFATEYQAVSEMEEDAKEKGENISRHKMPNTYRKIKTLNAFYFNRWNQSKPRFAHRGTGPEDEYGAHYISVVLNQDFDRCSGAMHLYDILQNTHILGHSFGQVLWHSRRTPVWRTQTKQNMFSRALGREAKPKLVRGVDVDQGVRLYSRTARRILTDPTVPIVHFHEGEFVINQTEKNRMFLKQLEREGVYYDIDRVPEDTTPITQGETTDKDTELSRHYRKLPVQSTGETLHDMVKLNEMWVWLLPEEWGLKRFNKMLDGPELWVLTLANDRRLIRADASLYSTFPFFALHANPDLEALTMPSTVDIARPWQNDVDWTMQMHKLDVRQRLIGRWAANPDMWDVETFKDNSVGALWLLREDYWNNPDAVKQGLMQYKHADAFADYANEINNLDRALDDATMASLTVSGEPLPTKRSASEVIQVTQSGAIPLEAQEQLFVEHGLRRMVGLMREMRQAFTTEDALVSLIGVETPPHILKKAVNSILRVPRDAITSTKCDFIGMPVRRPPDPAQSSAYLMEAGRVIAELSAANPEVAREWNPNKFIEKSLRLSETTRNVEELKRTEDEKQQFDQKMQAQAEAAQQAEAAAAQQAMEEQAAANPPIPFAGGQ
jgi:hypothetical protein